MFLAGLSLTTSFSVSSLATSKSALISSTSIGPSFASDSCSTGVASWVLSLSSCYFFTLSSHSLCFYSSSTIAVFASFSALMSTSSRAGGWSSSVIYSSIITSSFYSDTGAACSSVTGSEAGYSLSCAAARAFASSSLRFSSRAFRIISLKASWFFWCASSFSFLIILRSSLSASIPPLV